VSRQTCLPFYHNLLRNIIISVFGQMLVFDAATDCQNIIAHINRNARITPRHIVYHWSFLLALTVCNKLPMIRL